MKLREAKIRARRWARSQGLRMEEWQWGGQHEDMAHVREAVVRDADGRWGVVTLSRDPDDRRGAWDCQTPKELYGEIVKYARAEDGTRIPVSDDRSLT